MKWTTKLNTFLCPSDPYSGGINLCNYMASFGTTTYMPYFQQYVATETTAGVNQSETTGLFTIWKSYGIQSVTDGTSNTMAFAEALTGEGIVGYNQKAPNGGNGSQYRGNFVFIQSAFDANAPTSGDVYDLSTVPNALSKVATDIQTCAAAFRAQQPGSIADYRGYRWILGIPGSTMFNAARLPMSPFSTDAGFGIEVVASVATPIQAGQYPLRVPTQAVSM